jgi:hypothetical protein
MRTWPWTFAVLAVLSLTASSAGQVLPREVRERILEAVVEVLPYDGEAGRLVGSGGSGTIISPEGFVLTNFHVVGDDATGQSYSWHAIRVTDPRHPDREPQHAYWARFLAGDPRHDLAIIVIELLADESPLPPATVFPAVPVGDANALIPGDPITVVGYPGIGGHTVTVTTGIVSGWVGEDLTSGGKQWIKTDARIAGGNSGGGAFDERGLLVAIPTYRVQRNVRGFEEQNLLRPVTLALPLITAYVPGFDRPGGPQVAMPLPMPASTKLGSPAALDSLTGTLRTDDDTLGTGEYVHVVEREFVAGIPVQVWLRSTDFDVYLGVLGPDGAVVLEVDDTPGEGLDVRETFVPPLTGTYRLVITSAYPGETGTYHLDIDPAPPPAPGSPPAQVSPSQPSGPDAATESDPAAAESAPPDAGDPFAPITSAPPPSSREAISGELRGGDERLETGEYLHVIRRHLVVGSRVEVSLRSDAFDPYLIVAAPNGAVVLEVGDTPGERRGVRATFEPQVTGAYQLMVTSAFPGQTGPYQLDVAAAATTAAQVQTTPASGSPAPAPSTPLHERVSGNLRPGDATLAGGEYVNVIERGFSAGIPVELRLHSDEFAAVLFVATADVDILLEARSRPGGAGDATATFVPPRSGSYLVGITSVSPGETGAYHLELTIAAQR